MNLPFAPVWLTPVPFCLLALAAWLVIRRAGGVRPRPACTAANGSVAGPGPDPVEPEADGANKASAHRGSVPTTRSVLVCATSGALLSLLLPACFGGGSEAGLADYFVYLAVYYLVIAAAVVVGALLIYRHLSRQSAGDRWWRVLAALLGCLGALWSLCLWRFSVPPTEVHVRDFDRRVPLGGVTVTRLLYRANLNTAILGRQEGVGVAGSRFSAETDGDGTVILPGWVSLWPAGLIGISGVGVLADAQEHVFGLACVGLVDDEEYASASSCGGLSWTDGSYLRVSSHRTARRLSIQLVMRRIAAPGAGEAHLQVVESLLVSQVMGAAEVVNKVRAYVDAHGLTPSAAVVLSSISSMSESPAFPRPFPREGRTVGDLAAAFWGSSLDTYPGSLDPGHDGRSPAPGLVRKAILGEREPTGPGGSSPAPAWVPRPYQDIPYRPLWRSILLERRSDGSPSLVALGQAMWCEELLSLPELVEPARSRVIEGLAAAGNRLGADCSRTDALWPVATTVALVSEGEYDGAASALLSRIGVPFESVSHLRRRADKAGAAVALFPSDSLPQKRRVDASALETQRAMIEEYVGAGGTVVVFAHPSGDDLDVLPVPAGERLGAVGWGEAYLPRVCSARVVSVHAATAFAQGDTVKVAADGHFRIWPQGSDVLLAAADSGVPLALVYTYGAGRVVVTSLTEDRSFWNKEENADGLAFLAHLLRWAASAGEPSAVCRSDAACHATWRVDVTSHGGDEADTVRWQLASVAEAIPIAAWEERRTMRQGDKVTVSAQVDVATGETPPGLYKLTYELVDSKRAVAVGERSVPWLVQPAIACATLELFQAGPRTPGPVAISLSTPRSAAKNGASVPVRLTLVQLAGSPRRWFVELGRRNHRTKEWIQGERLDFVPENGRAVERALTVGPVHIRPELGINGGCWVRALVRTAPDAEPVASATVYFEPDTSS